MKHLCRALKLSTRLHTQANFISGEMYTPYEIDRERHNPKRENLLYQDQSYLAYHNTKVLIIMKLNTGN